jgi:hypothetical protein
MNGIAVRLAPKLAKVIPADNPDPKSGTKLARKHRLTCGWTPHDDDTPEGCLQRLLV